MASTLRKVVVLFFFGVLLVVNVWVLVSFQQASGTQKHATPRPNPNAWESGPLRQPNPKLDTGVCTEEKHCSNSEVDDVEITDPPAIKVWHNVFTEEELQKLLEYAKDINQPQPNLRSSTFPSFSLSHLAKVKRINPNVQWLYQKLSALCLSVNEQYDWGYQLNVHWTRNRKSHVDIDIMRFREGNFYELHSDVQSFDKFDLDDINHKACSIAVLLGDPAEYEGGDFYYYKSNFGEGKSLLAPKQKGVVVTWRAEKVYYGVKKVSKGETHVLLWSVPGFLP